MEKQSTNATAALTNMSLKDSTNDAGSGGSNLSSDFSSDDEDATLPTPPIRTTVYRRKEEDHTLAQLGVNKVIYYPRDNQFIAHPEDAATTPALVGKVPIPKNGEG